MTNLLDIIHRLFLIKAHDVSETGVCLRQEVNLTDYQAMGTLSIYCAEPSMGR
jgi:hypothetical protein